MFDALDAVFTPDAAIDYRAMGGIAGRYPGGRRGCAPCCRRFRNTGTWSATCRSDSTAIPARGRTICFKPMEVALPDGGTQVMVLGPWYADQFVRTARGWRIAERVKARCCCHNMPAALAGATD